MSNVEEIKKAMEGVDLRNIDQTTNERVWLSCANEDGEHASWFDPGDGGTPYIRADLVATTLEALQRENEALKQHVEELQEKIVPEKDCACSYDEAGAVCAAHSPMLKAAEAEVKRLRNKVAARALSDDQLSAEIKAIDETCKGGFGEGGGSPGEWWYERADELEHERKRRELENQLQQHNSRTALASAGEEHHAE